MFSRLPTRSQCCISADWWYRTRLRHLTSRGSSSTCPQEVRAAPLTPERRRADVAKVAPEQALDLTAAPEAAQAEVPPEVVAQTLGEYVRGYAARIRGGGRGGLPA